MSNYRSRMAVASGYNRSTTRDKTRRCASHNTNLNFKNNLNQNGKQSVVTTSGIMKLENNEIIKTSSRIVRNTVTIISLSWSMSFIFFILHCLCFSEVGSAPFQLTDGFIGDDTVSSLLRHS